MHGTRDGTFVGKTIGELVDVALDEADDLTFGEGGIVDVAAGTFIGLNKDSQDHGHSMERALNLFQCAQE